MIYQIPNLKRGLINYGVYKQNYSELWIKDMNLINKQIKLLQNRQRIIQHATKNQLKVLNATIGHIKSLEDTLNYNENLLINVTSRMQQQVRLYVGKKWTNICYY